MSQQENPNKQPKKIGPVTLTKNNLVKIAGATAIAVCGIVGVNSYFSYQHQVFLESYTNAIASIDNGEQTGYKNAFKVLKDLADDDKATPSDLYYLGYIYQYGLGTTKDYSDAYKYYKKAATSDNAMAYYQLATLYENGNGVNKDQIDEVILGQVLTAGSGQNPARQAAIEAGLPYQTPSMTINKVCGSGLKAITISASPQAIA